MSCATCSNEAEMCSNYCDPCQRRINNGEEVHGEVSNPEGLAKFTVWTTNLEDSLKIFKYFLSDKPRWFDAHAMSKDWCEFTITFGSRKQRKKLEKKLRKLLCRATISSSPHSNTEIYDFNNPPY